MELPIKTKSQRRKIYESLLEKYEKNEFVFALCISLFYESGRGFLTEHPEADIQFPEFGKFLKSINGDVSRPEILQYADLYKESRDKWRIKVLKECIEMCNENKD